MLILTVFISSSLRTFLSPNQDPWASPSIPASEARHFTLPPSRTLSSEVSPHFHSEPPFQSQAQPTSPSKLTINVIEDKDGPPKSEDPSEFDEDDNEVPTVSNSTSTSTKSQQAQPTMDGQEFDLDDVEDVTQNVQTKAPGLPPTTPSAKKSFEPRQRSMTSPSKFNRNASAMMVRDRSSKPPIFRSGSQDRVTTRSSADPDGSSGELLLLVCVFFFIKKETIFYQTSPLNIKP